MPTSTTPFLIDTGDHWFSHPTAPSIRYFEIGAALQAGHLAKDLNEHDTRIATTAVAEAIRRGVEQDPDLADFALEWIDADPGVRWPDTSRIVVSVEQGGSEGWMLEIYSLTRNAGPFRPIDPLKPNSCSWTAIRLISVKTFEGERVWLFARKVSQWLGLS